MKNNYPIKYAIMPILDQKELNIDGREVESDQEVIAYIVSKCYVIKEENVYLKNGTKKTGYEVVFPYEKTTNNEWQRIEPEYGLLTGQCNNSINVDCVFDSYEDALKEAEIKNKELLSKTISHISFCNIKEQLVDIKETFQQQISRCKILEQSIEHKTDDLDVNVIPKKQNIIIVGKAKIGESDFSLYDAMELWSNQKYAIYTLTEPEYSSMIVALKKGCNLNGYSKDCIAINNPQQKVVKLMDNNSDSLCYLTSGKLINGNRIADLIFDESNAEISFYTLENYEDIVKSFFVRSSADELQLNNKKMAKKLRIEIVNKKWTHLKNYMNPNSILYCIGVL